MKSCTFIRSLGIAVLGLGLSLNSFAQSGDASEENPSTEEGENQEAEYALPGFKEAPSRLIDSKFENDEGEEFGGLTVDVGGQVVAGFPDSGEDVLRGSALVTVGLDLEFVAAELGLNAEQFLTEAIDSDYDDESGFLEGPLRGRRAKDLIETAKVVVTPFKLGEDEWAVFSVVVGRDNATPVGSYVAEWVPSINVLESRQLDQQDLIKVQATFVQHVTVEVVAFGFDWLPRVGEATDDIEQDGDGSIAINLEADIAKMMNPDSEFGLEIYFSYADVKDGTVYASALDGDQPGENEQISTGVRLSMGQLVVSGEFTSLDSESFGREDRLSLYGFYSIDRVTPFVGYEVVDADSMDEKEDIITFGVGYKLARGLMLALQIAVDDDDDINTMLALTYGKPALTMSDMRSE